MKALHSMNIDLDTSQLLSRLESDVDLEEFDTPPIISDSLESIMEFDHKRKSIEIRSSGATKENIFKLKREDLVYLDEILNKRSYSFSPSSLGLAKVFLDNILYIFLEKNAPSFLFDEAVKLREKLSKEFYTELTSTGMQIQNWNSFGTFMHMEQLNFFFQKNVKFVDNVSLETIEYMCRKVIISEPETDEDDKTRFALMVQLRLLIDNRKGVWMNFSTAEASRIISKLKPSQKQLELEKILSIVKNQFKNIDTKN
jgi:hypothetical protein